MSINFEKFDKVHSAIVPILNGVFQYNRKKYNVSESVNGWFLVVLKGNDVLKENIISIEADKNVKLKTVGGYTYNNNFIFQNFDVGKRKLGVDVMTQLHFNTSPTFSSIKAVLWEDKNLYYHSPNYKDLAIFKVKQVFDNLHSSGGAGISNIKGITPELKTLFLFHDIQRIDLEKELIKVKKEKEFKAWRETLPGRIAITFARVGAKLLNYSVSGNRITVDWQLINSEEKFNSVIDASTFKVLEAGYCLSGSDKDHNVTSMVLLAEDYEKDGLIYKTRRNE